jgi:hypothetical protein
MAQTAGTSTVRRMNASCRARHGNPGGTCAEMAELLAGSVATSPACSASGLCAAPLLRTQCPRPGRLVWRPRGAGRLALGHLAAQKPRSGRRVREPRRLPRGLNRAESAALLSSFCTDRDRAIAGLMLVVDLREFRGRMEFVDVAAVVQFPAESHLNRGMIHGNNIPRLPLFPV